MRRTEASCEHILLFRTLADLQGVAQTELAIAIVAGASRLSLHEELRGAACIFGGAIERDDRAVAEAGTFAEGCRRCIHRSRVNMRVPLRLRFRMTMGTLGGSTDKQRSQR